MKEAGQDFEAVTSDQEGATAAEDPDNQPSKPKKVKLKPVSKNPRNRQDDPNVLGFQESSSEEEESSSDESDKGDQANTGVASEKQPASEDKSEEVCDKSEGKRASEAVEDSAKKESVAAKAKEDVNKSSTDSTTARSGFCLIWDLNDISSIL